MPTQLTLPGIAYRNPSPAEDRSIYPDPSRVAQDAKFRAGYYALLWHYYTNTAFEDLALWARYRLKQNLYTYTRSIVNPLALVVDFYAEHVYPGQLSPEVDLPNGVQSAIPLSHDVPDAVRQAVAQSWQWGNWQTGQSLMVTYGALTGNCLVEVVDDLEAGKVRYLPRWPGHVSEIVLDDYGNVRGYVVEYDVVDRAARTRYRYAKEVLPDVIRYYKDGHKVGEQPNPYPFVPAVWVKHLDIGADYGVPAAKTGLAKIDEINSVVSHTVDHIHKQINSPRVMWSKTEIKDLFGRKIEEMDLDERNGLLLLRGAENGKTETLVGNLDPQTIIPLVEKLIGELEKDYPEITMYQKLREQNIVTAPAARTLMGDVVKKMSRPAANYDTASVKLFQMALAIGGWRANSGAWGFGKNSLTPQQRKFLPFGFDSYSRGDLDMTILPRPLVHETTKESADELQVRSQAVQALKDTLPVEELLKILGKRDDEIPAIVTKLKAEQAKKQADAIALTQAQAAAKGANKSQPAQTKKAA